VNYRHAFHAGNFADVLKHAVLALALERLRAKPAPFVYVDTHAGAGRYDLAGDAARRTNEAADGIVRLLEGAPIPALADYLGVVRALNAGEPSITRYPGSPWLARKLTRVQDRLLLCEAHPEESLLLRRAMSGDVRVELRQADGWQALKSDLPPTERRGLVLIDPPFEAKDEHERLARGLKHAWRRWATGSYLAWYPIKARGPVDALHAGVVAAGLRRVHALELLLEPEDETHLVGCGLLLVNPPWPMLDRLAVLLPELARRLSRGPEPRATLATLVGE